MDFENLINAFIPYGLPSLIIGVATGVAFYFTDLVLSKNLKSVNPYLPLGVSFALTLVYALIFSPTQTFSEQTVSAGLLSGSLSVAIFVFIKNLKNGNTDCETLKSLFACYTDNKKAASLYKKTAKLLKNGLNEEEFLSELDKIIAEEGLNAFAAQQIVSALKSEYESTVDKDKR